MGSTPGSGGGGNTGSLGCQGGVSRAGFGVSPGFGAGGWKGPPGLGLCWFKPFSLHRCGNRCRSANMREPLLALREETRMRFSPGRNFRRLCRCRVLGLIRAVDSLSPQHRHRLAVVSRPLSEAGSCALAGLVRSVRRIPVPESPVSSRHPASRRRRRQDRQSADYSRRHSTRAGCRHEHYRLPVFPA